MDTIISGVASDGLAKGVEILGDFAPLLGVLVGIAAAGLLVGVFATFVRNRSA